MKPPSKSLKTFYLYTIIVFIVIGISLSVKAFFIMQQSKVDPAHNFTLVVLKHQRVKEIISFHPQTPSLSILVVRDNAIAYTMLAKVYGIVSDGYIQIDDGMPLGTDVTTSLWASFLHTSIWQSDLTVFDKMRLLLFVKSVTSNNKTIKEITLTNQGPDFNTIIANTLTDQDISNENISIQIINATAIAGFGQRLGKELTNMGANVVDVSSAQNTQVKTTIAYYGNDSYTLKRIQKLLGVQVIKLSRQSIADIVITIGEDKRNTRTF